MPHEDYCYALERENHALNEKYESQATQLARANARIEAMSQQYKDLQRQHAALRQQEWLSRKLAVAAEPGGIMACEPSRLDTLNEELRLARQANEAQHQQLAAALAACKVKDEALLIAINYTDYYNPEYPFIAGKEALAIQPDDSALKAFMLSKGVSYE